MLFILFIYLFIIEMLVTLGNGYNKQQEINQELKDALDETKNENKALNRKIEALKNVSIQKEGNIIYLFNVLSF